MRGIGRATFAATLLLIVGTINIIYGIGALGNANIFHNGQRFVFSDLNTMGWILIVLGIIQLTGGLSLISGNPSGRIIAIVAASLGALGALFSISGPNPWWSLAVFFLCIYIIHGIFVYGDDAADLRRGRDPLPPSGLPSFRADRHGPGHPRGSDGRHQAGERADEDGRG